MSEYLPASAFFRRSAVAAGSLTDLVAKSAGSEVYARQKSLAGRNNAFGFLRLLFASLVIVSHTPELVDGDRKRELLTRLFHTLSFGELAVGGFFLVSGFLITGSFLTSPRPLHYLRNRITRIYPAFVVCSLICVFVVAPMAGNTANDGLAHRLVAALLRIGLLYPPDARNAFPGTPYHSLDGATWTIQYEFLCYLLVLCLGCSGLLKSWRFVGLAAIACLLTSAFAPPVLENALNQLPMNDLLFRGNRISVFRLVGLFLSGSAFYLIQWRIPISKSLAAGAFFLLCLVLLVPKLAVIGVALFGSYVVFTLAALGSGTVFAKLNNRNDVSYGVYLYAWPIEQLLISWGFSANLLVLGSATFLFALIAGTLSWFIVERPAIQLVRRLSSRRAFKMSTAAVI